jgi:hypothetical protein
MRTEGTPGAGLATRERQAGGCACTWHAVSRARQPALGGCTPPLRRRRRRRRAARLTRARAVRARRPPARPPSPRVRHARSELELEACELAGACLLRALRLCLRHVRAGRFELCELVGRILAQGCPLYESHALARGLAGCEETDDDESEDESEDDEDERDDDADDLPPLECVVTVRECAAAPANATPRGAARELRTAARGGRDGRRERGLARRPRWRAGALACWLA